ncbi:MAG: hypothetical protein Q9207_006612 [Kuettlingeria erythrocarpa]
MRSILIPLVFALSVSARCVKKQATSEQQGPQKMGAQNGDSAMFGNMTLSGGQDSPVKMGGSSSSSDASSSSSPPAGSSSTPTTGSSTSSTDKGATGPASPTPSGDGSVSATTVGGGSGSAGSGSCGSIKGVCFNSGMQLSMYDKITTSQQWLTFQPTLPGDGICSDRTRQDHVPMMPFASNVAEAVNLVNGPNPPPWMLTFNEPDYSYMGFTPTMSPQEAAEAIKPLLAKPGKNTFYVAPVTADPMSSWVDDFFAACNCKDFFSAYNIHQYQPTSKATISTIESFRARYQDKPIWITEIAPGNAGCSLGWDAVNQYMKDIYKFAKNSGYIDRVFWNTGNQLGNEDQNVCNSWLMDKDGNPGPLLEMFEAIDCT